MPNAINESSVNYIFNGENLDESVLNRPTKNLVQAINSVLGSSDFNAKTVSLTADNTTNATRYPLFSYATTGDKSPRTDSGFTYNPSTGTLTATTFSGALSGNATTATTLQTARTITATGDATSTAVSFNGSSNISIPLTIAATTVTGKALTGFSSTTGTITATDTILTAINKLNGNLSSAVAGGVSSVSVTSANGLAGTSSGGTTPAITLNTTVTGMVKGNGTSLSAAVAGTDYVIPSGSVQAANQFVTARTIAMTGDVSWTSASFNGTANVTGTATLANSGVTAGTYKSVTVDAKGRVTSGTNPTTVAGYGITDAIVKTGATGGAYLPSGTTAQRPTGVTGTIRYNSTLSRFEGYGSSAWGSLGGATGGGSDDVFYENSRFVNTNYTISTGKNAMSAGPIIIADGVTVTIGDDSTWVVV